MVLDLSMELLEIYQAQDLYRLNVRTQTLENSKTFPPQAHIFTKDKDEWVNLSNINNCFKKMYDPKETWPKESLIRIKEYLNTKK